MSSRTTEYGSILSTIKMAFKSLNFSTGIFILLTTIRSCFAQRGVGGIPVQFKDSFVNGELPAFFPGTVVRQFISTSELEKIPVAQASVESSFNKQNTKAFNPPPFDLKLSPLFTNRLPAFKIDLPPPPPYTATDTQPRVSAISSPSDVHRGPDVIESQLPTFDVRHGARNQIAQIFSLDLKPRVIPEIKLEKNSQVAQGVVMDSVTPTVCIFKPVEGDDRFYLQDVGDRWLKRRCALGTAFDVQSCECSRTVLGDLGDVDLADVTAPTPAQGLHVFADDDLMFLSHIESQQNRLLPGQKKLPRAKIMFSTKDLLPQTKLKRSSSKTVLPASAPLSQQAPTTGQHLHLKGTQNIQVGLKNMPVVDFSKLNTLSEQLLSLGTRKSSRRPGMSTINIHGLKMALSETPLLQSWRLKEPELLIPPRFGQNVWLQRPPPSTTAMKPRGPAAAPHQWRAQSLGLGSMKTRTKCKLRAYKGDNRYYLQKLRDGKWMKRRCALGTAYSQSSCDCSQSRPLTPYDECAPEVFVNFTTDVSDVSGNQLPLGNYNVRVENGSAIFDGTARLIMWRYINYDFQKEVMLRLRFKVFPNSNPGTGHTVPILTNCDYDPLQPSIGIVLNRFTNILSIFIQTYTEEAAVLDFLIDPKHWVSVTLAYDGHTLSAAVNRNTRSVAASGLIQIRPSALVLGHCEKYGWFQGLIDDVYVYTCIPAPA